MILKPGNSRTQLIRAGLEVETVDHVGADVTGPVVIGKVVDFVEEPQKNGKTIRWCQVDVGEEDLRGIVCGARNFAVGDHVVVALPGSVLSGDFAIAARKTYGHVSDGMICSARELGLGDDHEGIMVLADDDLVPGADAAPVLLLRDDVLDIAVTPDRGYCLSLRGLAREAAQATGVAFTDPVDRPVPLGGHRRSSGRARVRCLPAVRRDRRDRDRREPAEPALAVAAGATGGDAVDLARRRRHELRDAGDRAADPRATTRTGSTGRSWSAGRPTARSSPRWTTWPATAARRRPVDHRRLRTDRPGRGDGWGDDRDLRRHHQRDHRGGALRRDDHRPHLAPAQAVAPRRRRRFERGVDPAAAYAAAHRVAQLLVELPAGRSCRGRDRRRRAATAGHHHDRRRPARRASSAPMSITTPPSR